MLGVVDIDVTAKCRTGKAEKLRDTNVELVQPRSKQLPRSAVSGLSTLVTTSQMSCTRRPVLTPP
jgi:hypothetical protein